MFISCNIKRAGGCGSIHHQKFKTRKYEVKFDIIDGPAPLPQCKFSTSAKKQNVIYLENVQNKPSARPRNTLLLPARISIKLTQPAVL